MPQLMPETPDPLMPFTSRFPLSPTGGRITPSSALPSGPATRPFGLRYAVRPVECGKHSKKPTNKTRTEETQCNPAGQWRWLAEETGLPIADAIAAELVGAA